MVWVYSNTFSNGRCFIEPGQMGLPDRLKDEGIKYFSQHTSPWELGWNKLVTGFCTWSWPVKHPKDRTQTHNLTPWHRNGSNQPASERRSVLNLITGFLFTSRSSSLCLLPVSIRGWPGGKTPTGSSRSTPACVTLESRFWWVISLFTSERRSK